MIRLTSSRLLATLLLALNLPPAASAQTLSAEAGPDLTLIADGGVDGPIEASAWLPSSTGRPAPLVVISHGNGGHALGHVDTARALAQAGFVVAALTHPGDNYRDPSRSTQLTGRPPQLSRLIDHMIGPRFTAVALDADRIGAFGFSAGGFTVTTAIGGQADLPAILDHCTVGPDEFACRLLTLQPIEATAWRPNARDPRIRAAVIAAPALGFAFTDESLADVHVPVQLWQAEHDAVLPSPHHVEPIRDRLATPPDFHLVPGAGHYDFLPPCSPPLAQAVPEICGSAPGFDRTVFHAQFDRDVVDFFRRHLGDAEDAPDRWGS